MASPHQDNVDRRKELTPVSMVMEGKYKWRDIVLQDDGDIVLWYGGDYVVDGQGDFIRLTAQVIDYEVLEVSTDEYGAQDSGDWFSIPDLFLTISGGLFSWLVNSGTKEKVTVRLGRVTWSDGTQSEVRVVSDALHERLLELSEAATK